ncbi:hypothetical protein ACFX2I_035743 [Malus domestica]
MIPICFTAVAQLDLSHLSSWGYALLSPSAANTAHLLLAQHLRNAFPRPSTSEWLLNNYNQARVGKDEKVEILRKREMSNSESNKKCFRPLIVWFPLSSARCVTSLKLHHSRSAP